MNVPLSILDLAEVRRGDSVADALAFSTTLAQHAERWGYRRVWYAEHHNMPKIASAATSVLIAHIAAHTEGIRLGAGGVMLPNHAPLTVAEQYGTLATLHPERIDLGVGRAPGSDQRTARALRRNAAAADRFADDVAELRGYLTGEPVVPGVAAIPGHGTNVPLHVLGSSLFGARVAAALGLPYAFASHFAPAALSDAVAAYRREFEPSAQLDAPYVIAGVNVIATETRAEAEEQFAAALRARARLVLGRGRRLTDDEADALLASPAGAPARQMLEYAAVGTPGEVAAYLERFAAHADADELILASAAVDGEVTLRTFEHTATVCGLPAAA